MKEHEKISANDVKVNDRVRFYFDERKIGYADCTVVDVSTVQTEGFCYIVLDGETARRAMDVSLLYKPD